MVDKICDLPEGYEPSEDEVFMNPLQREYFRRKLEKWKQKLLSGSEDLFDALKDDGQIETDDIDRAANETDLVYTLRSKERAAKLIAKIDEALEKIRIGTYGYCAETGEPISLGRLKARPVASLGIKAQERHEKHEKETRDDS